MDKQSGGEELNSNKDKQPKAIFPIVSLIGKAIKKNEIDTCVHSCFLYRLAN
jgi:hypothetical protein